MVGSPQLPKRSQASASAVQPTDNSPRQNRLKRCQIADLRQPAGVAKSPVRPGNNQQGSTERSFLPPRPPRPRFPLRPSVLLVCSLDSHLIPPFSLTSAVQSTYTKVVTIVYSVHRGLYLGERWWMDLDTISVAVNPVSAYSIIPSVHRPTQSYSFPSGVSTLPDPILTHEQPSRSFLT